MALVSHAMLEAFDIVARAVADRSRVRILKLLEPGELCVCQITAVLRLAPATVSKHLSVLKAAGLVFQRKEGRWVYYRLADRTVNPYALSMLIMIQERVDDDPTLAEDRARLARVNSLSLETLCDQGAAAVDAVACCQ
ncbi:MAG: metalloregulator ArsR/SmtB family transcription factor [Pseudomonadota bacterium]